MRDTFNSKEREYKRLSKIAYSNWGQGGVCVVLLVFYPLPAVVVFEVQRECLKGRGGGGSTPSPAGTSGLAKADIPHFQHIWYLLMKPINRSRALMVKCHASSCSFDSSRFKVNLCKKIANHQDNETDCFLHRSEPQQLDRVVPKCSWDLENRGSSSANELKIPD